MSLDSMFKLVSVFLLIVIGEVVTQSYNPTRLSNGQIVDSLKRFPHHVTIETDANQNEENRNRLCGGSILSAQWILTSGLCVDGSEHIQLHFKMLYNHYNYNDSFSIVVNKDEIYMHPTNYYDIALIHIPVQLVFSDTLKPVSLSSSSVNTLEGRLAVMPGFEIPRKPATTTTTTTTTTTSGPEITTTTPVWTTTQISSYKSKRYVRNLSYSFDQPQQLIYGMFRILSNRRCKRIDSEFDEYLQICTENWMKTSERNESFPCSNYGSGLLVGWPAESKLIGIYSVLLNNCSSSEPAVYTNIAEYLPWIESIIDIPP